MADYCTSYRTARICGFALLAVLCVAPAYANRLFFDLRAGYAYDSNLNRAEPHAQREEDSIFELGGSAGYRLQVTRNSGLILKAALETDIHAQISDLDTLNASVQADYIIQPNRSFTSIWYALTAAFSVREHDDSDIRDATMTTLGAGLGKRLTDRIAVQARYRYYRRRADEGATFDADQHEVSLTGDYRISDRVTAYAGYSYLDGDLVSTAGPSPKFMGAATAFAPDPPFNSVAWRLDGHTHSGTLGTRVSFTRHTGIDARVDYVRARATNDNRWSVWNAGLSLIHRF